VCLVANLVDHIKLYGACTNQFYFLGKLVIM
jgi:hypothetical protein